jgi:thioredoxin 2
MIGQAVCPHCGAANRIPADRDGKAAKCGQCHQTLFSGAPIEVDDARLKRHLEKTSGHVLVDIWAPWCGPCRAMAPHFAEAARRLEPDVRLLKLNADDSALAAQLGVRAIPTMILFANGRERARHSGVMTADQLAAWTRAHMDAQTTREKESLA